MRRSLVCCTAILVASASLAACQGDDGGEGVELLVDAAPDRFCPQGERVFASVTTHECGLGPEGKPALCQWVVRLNLGGDGTVEWHHSDVVETGTYDCANGNLLGKLGTHIVRGSLQSAQSLVWDNVNYQAGEPTLR